MTGVVLTAYNGSILGPIAKVLGWIMNLIYMGFSRLGIESIILCIVFITIIIYMCLLPLTIKQQKFSKLQQKMQPEIQAIQNKYKNKKDQASMQAMQQETQLVYEKYGVSPMKSTKCPYYPTCSTYGLQAVEKYGAVKGGALAAWRILRCNPFSKGGYDPVP